jgi:uncharacterized phage protein (TIGR02220 family)
MAPARVEASLTELEQQPNPDDSWVVRDPVVLWVRNGLRHDPNMHLSDPKHRKRVLTWIEGLPRTDVVDRFMAYYSVLKRKPDGPSKQTGSPEQTSLVSAAPESSNPMTDGTDPDSAEAILAWLNEKAGKAYRPVAQNLDLIRARLEDGFRPWQLRAIVSRKCTEWNHEPHNGDRDMRRYLRPATLFNRTKAEQYVGELPKTETPS